MDCSDARIGHNGVCPACLKLFWCDPADSGETMACPHCGQKLYWLNGEFHIVESRPDKDEKADNAETDRSGLSGLALLHAFMTPMSQPENDDHRDIDLTTWITADDVLRLIPQSFSFGRRVAPLALERDGAILVAVADPFDFETLDTLRFIVNRVVRYVVKDATEIAAASKRWYGSGH